VANLPYNVATAIIRKFLESENPPELMVLMVQKEVGQRICSNPPKMSILAISVQLYGTPKIISNVSAGSFWPMPKVDSTILKIVPRIDTDAKQINTDLFFKIVRAGFSQPRKQIIGNLNKILGLNKPEIQNWLAENNINPSQRAETLSIKNWLDLTRTLPVVF
ncbi:MAG: rRNA adenine dimethyltransferase family protein, partial [Candidatus Berkelbacteria bacterium]|nr:rRNA adenine dimethyltransferase family protein [Candidatus Berkelbacteria bacterium]